MNEHTLARLLKDAEASASSTASRGTADLAERVVRRYQRQRKVQRATFALAAMVLIAAGSALWQRGHNRVRGNDVAKAQQNVAVQKSVTAQQDITGQQEVAAQQNDNSRAGGINSEVPAIAELRSDIARTTAMVHNVLASSQRLDRIAALQRELAELEALDPTAQRVHATAAISVSYADDQLALGMQSEAASAYRRVTELFAGTPGALVAQQRLNEMQMN